MMIIGILAAVFASLAYGVSSVLQALGARTSRARAAACGDAGMETSTGAPTIKSTIAAMLTVTFLVGTVLDVAGFGGGAVAARFSPLFLSQTIISANLVVTALLGIVVLHTRLYGRDWAAIATVIVSLGLLGLSAHPGASGRSDAAFHWTLLIVTVALLAFSVVLVRWLGARGAIAAGLCAGVLFGVVAIATRVLRGFNPLDIGTILTDPAAYALLVAGVGGFYIHTVALQLGSVNSATAALVVGETVVPGAVGVWLLGDSTEPGLGWLAVVGFIGAVVGAVAVSWSAAVEQEGSAAIDSDPLAGDPTPR